MLAVLPARNANIEKNQQAVRWALLWARDSDLQLHTPADVAVALYASSSSPVSLAVLGIVEFPRQLGDEAARWPRRPDGTPST